MVFLFFFKSHNNNIKYTSFKAADTKWWNPDWALDHLTANHHFLPLFLFPPSPPSELSIDQRGHEGGRGSSFVSMPPRPLNPDPRSLTPPLLPPSPSTSFAHHIPLLPRQRRPLTSLRHLHLLSIKRIGSFPPLNTTFMFGSKEGTCECNQTYSGYLRTGSCGIIFIIAHHD